MSVKTFFSLEAGGTLLTPSADDHLDESALTDIDRRLSSRGVRYLELRPDGPLRTGRRGGGRDCARDDREGRSMIYSVLRRTLRDGVTFEQFREAWAPPGGLGHADFDVVHCRSLQDDRQILSIGTHDMSAEDFAAFATSDAFVEVNQLRHERITPLVEETDGFIGAFEVIEGDHISL